MIRPATALVVAAWIGAAAVVPRGAPPTVARVDPPSWWAGHSINPVRLLVRGAGLSAATLRSRRGDVRPGNVKVNAAGTYLFADVAIDRGAHAGAANLQLVTPSGTVDVPFEIVPPLPRRGRFQGFDQDDAIYLLMPDRFSNGDPSNDRPRRSESLLDRGKSRFYHGGDLQGVIDRLPYLDDLGVTTIWMTPIYDNADTYDPERRYDGQPFTDYHGYGATDFYSVDEHFGDLAALRRLVDAAHARGMKVMQDQVANHTGPAHPWAGDPPLPDWFHGTPATHVANSFNVPLLLDPRASPTLRRQILDGWFANLLPDLNQDQPEVARYLIQNSLWWVGVTGIDAIRQDTVPYVPKTFWQAWTQALAREYPELPVLGEVLEESPHVVAAFQGSSTGIRSLFDYPLYFALRKVFARGGGVRGITDVIAQDGEYADPARLVTLLGSHDVRRFMGEAGATPAALKLAATVVITTRGIPMWYYGDEIAMPGADDPDNRRDFPGGWPGDPRSAFDSSGRSAEEAEVFAHVRTLFHLRRDHEALRRGALTHLACSESLYVYARSAPAGTIVVAVNSGKTAAHVDVAVEGLALREGAPLRNVLSSSGAATTVRANRIAFDLPAMTSAVFAPR